jgi:hypothetical protein
MGKAKRQIAHFKWLLSLLYDNGDFKPSIAFMKSLSMLLRAMHAHGAITDHLHPMPSKLNSINQSAHHRATLNDRLRANCC